MNTLTGNNKATVLPFLANKDILKVDLINKT